MSAEVSKNQSSDRNSSRKRLFRLVAILLGLAPFLLLEISLRALDVGSPSSEADPLAGFSSVRNLFERDEENQVYRSVRAMSEYFGPQKFAIQKPEFGCRIFCLGGSTVRGRPFKNDTAFPHWMQLEFSARDSSRSYEVVNCGGVSYASYRLLPVLKEVLEYQPDVIVVATGHNEFLEDRTYQSIKERSGARVWIEDRLYALHTVNAAKQLFAPDAGSRQNSPTRGLTEKVTARLDSDSGYASYHRDDVWQQQVIEQYENSLRRMAQLCKQAGVPLVLVNLGSNVRDSPPYKSEHKSGLAPQAEADWQKLFDAGSEQEISDPAAALKHYQQAEKIDAEYALLLYRMARCFDRLKQPKKAREYYLRARDLDVCPLRMLERMHGIVKTVAGETETPLVDVRNFLELKTDLGVLGNRWFLDHVHPSIGGHQQIARALVARLNDSQLISLSEGWSPQQRRAAYREHLDQLGARYLADGARRVGWLENWARRQRLFDETLPADAAGYVRYGFRSLDFGDHDGAFAAFEAGMQIDYKVAPDVLERAADLINQGRPQTAQQLIDLFASRFISENLETELQLARLVLAIETNQQDLAVEIYREHQSAFKQTNLSDSSWLTIIPGVLNRAAKLAQ